MGNILVIEQQASKELFTIATSKELYYFTIVNSMHVKSNSKRPNVSNKMPNSKQVKSLGKS